MEYAIPPSYIEATNRDWLPIVAPYLSTITLISAVVVSRRWHEVLTPYLWGDPASHFNVENELVYNALTRFMRTLPKARLEVRELTHTLYLPPAQSELYGTPQVQWLRDVLEKLPKLQRLVVSRIPFFDHAALLALKNLSSQLRLLIATGCNNCTPASLGPALLSFPYLTFLDLSYTRAAREESVLEHISFLHHLQILKLRHVGLRDQDWKVLAGGLYARTERRHPAYQHAYRLRSLDVRDNLLTDESIKFILVGLIHATHDVHGQEPTTDAGREGESSSRRHAVPARVHGWLRSSNLDTQFVQGLSRSGSNQMILDDLDRVGLTHLYLAGNAISTNGLHALVKTGNLHVLDAGNLRNDRNKLVAPDETARLTHALEEYSATSLTYLRVDHTVVTRPAGPVEQESIESDTIEQQPSNMNGTLPSTNSRANHSIMNAAIPETHAAAPAYQRRDELSPQRAPPSYDASATASVPTQDIDNRLLHYTPSQTLLSQTTSTLSSSDVILEIERIHDGRQQLRYRRRENERGLLPGRVPSIQTVVLTSVPAYTHSKQIVRNLQSFIKDCAIETHLAQKQARLEQSLVSSSSNTDVESINSRSKQLFALQTIVLELAPNVSSTSEQDNYSPSQKASRSKTVSAIDDADADAFWEASQDDFSFFKDEKYGVPVFEQKRSQISNNSLIPDAQSKRVSGEPLQDVVAEIARWRAEIKLRFHSSPRGTFVPEYWPGEVRILRPGHKDQAGDLDLYHRLFMPGRYR